MLPQKSHEAGWHELSCVDKSQSHHYCQRSRGSYIRGGTVVTMSCVKKKTNKTKPVVAQSQLNINLLTKRNPDILGILRCQISADGSQQARDQASNQGGDTT